MSGLSFDGAITTGHGQFPPTTIIATQSKVFVDGKAVCREDDPIVPHTRTTMPYDTHSGVIVPKTTKVYIMGKKAAQIGDAISCGDTIAEASGKTFL